jgi:hypothetical protein
MKYANLQMHVEDILNACTHLQSLWILDVLSQCIYSTVAHVFTNFIYDTLSE